MTKEHSSFQDLVASAPLAPSEGPVSLVGTLARSKDDGKFVLLLSDGGSLTLKTSDVKSHTVLGNSLGLNVVQVEVEAHAIRDLNFFDPSTFRKIPQLDPPQKLPIVDILHSPFHKTPDEQIKGISEGIGPSSAYFDQLHSGRAPFLLAAHHQAPVATVAALQAYQAALSR